MSQIDTLRNAIIATDAYLGLEAKIESGDNSDKTAQEFIQQVVDAQDFLNALTDLSNHDYIKSHIQNVHDLTVARNADYSDEEWSTVPVSSFKDFIQPPAKASDEEATMETDIQKDIDNLEWHDIISQYDDEELITDPENDEDLTEELQEDISATSRMRKRLSFARTELKRDLSRKIKLMRQSSTPVLKRRAVNTARQLIYTRLLRGRDKSKLSATEKNRIEGIAHRMEKQGILSRIAIRIMPRIRKIEHQRLTRNQ